MSFVQRLGSALTLNIHLHALVPDGTFAIEHRPSLVSLSAQPNGKLERFHKTTNGDAIRPGSAATADEARRIMGGYVHHHPATDDVTPADTLSG